MTTTLDDVTARKKRPPASAEEQAVAVMVPPCWTAVWATTARPRPEPGMARAAGAR
ncbi:MAG TPA: hypothetical protein VFO68_04295 [Actinophytocola sp.]|nr:hypothetical protein [Actinophytocola sp.]HET9138562.1 hypothetical protein [Actinophytocola sp.]